MHNNFFFFSFFFPLGVCLHGELSGEEYCSHPVLSAGWGKLQPVGDGGVCVTILGLSSSLLGPTAAQRKGFNYEVTPWGM